MSLAGKQLITRGYVYWEWFSFQAMLSPSLSAELGPQRLLLGMSVYDFQVSGCIPLGPI